MARDLRCAQEATSGALATMAGFLANSRRTNVAGSGMWHAGAGTSRVQALRDALTAASEAGRGRIGTADLAAASGIHASLISGLLKADIISGRVLRHHLASNSRCVEFEISASFDENLRQRLAAARALLVRHGYEVSMASAG